MRRRLALRLMLVPGVVLALLFVALDVWVDRAIYAHFDRSLADSATAIGRALERRGIDRPLEYGWGGHTEFFTVYDAEGVARLTSPNSRGVALARGPAERVLPRWFDARLPDGHAGRLLATPLALPGHAPLLLVVGTEREHWDRIERDIHTLLAGGIALALLLVLALSLWLVRDAFGFLTRAGARMAEVDADRGIPPQGGPRELAPFVEAVRHGIERLQAAVRRERRFARDAAHELRTPVAEIRTVAEAALDDPDATRARTALQATAAAAARMQRGIDALLSLARIESGQETPSVDPLDLVPLLQAALAPLHDAAQVRGLQLQLALPASAWVLGDVGMLERILANLAGNAAEYAPDGSAVSIVLQRGPDGWRLVLENAAPDLAEDDLPCLGTRFWRKRSEGGTAQHTGLGLALSAALAQAAGWSLAFSLEDGRLRVALGPLPAV